MRTGAALARLWWEELAACRGPLPCLSQPEDILEVLAQIPGGLGALKYAFLPLCLVPALGLAVIKLIPGPAWD